MATSMIVAACLLLSEPGLHVKHTFGGDTLAPKQA